ncbi:TPA: hypothetical protein SL809_001706 [Pseudomonas aeruginosa]|uniref:hypothetical protein n=1 Tax=Pseudomonas aeruginosa TaxID=287 RepID=UPI0006770098|nr:hypothetical protein [Pseudomonas aeruginosa]EIU3709966.1 hypothetical protein [Pseudomonas aeruginosa]EIU3904149.1 hypothetical protein [Pseudomonas aeruginosa]EKV3211970.1 hypothetical protein [Pseudomonas aeruginosa]ELK4809485.1 hypothetical protein [Pseudomonas aeruginosa]ELP1332974.1 hypothetical protein [Pseudomonas aeruginosa]
MITKKISRMMPEKLLRIIRKRYVDKHGEGVRNLGDFPILITAHNSFSDEMPEVIEERGGVQYPRLLDMLKELEHRGFVRFDGNYSYFLTVDGYKEASMSTFARGMRWFEVHPGIATLIALLSLLISIIALFVSGVS